MNRLDGLQPLNQFKSGVQCGACQQVIISTYGHDFNYCKCGETFVDGGDHYMRIGFGKKHYSHVSIDMINREIYTQEDGDRPILPLPWALLYNLWYPLDGKPVREEKSHTERWPY